MNRSICNQLDAYLLGGLSPDAVAGFREHLAGCSTCREAVAQQEQIDRCLRRATREIEPVPSDLLGRIRKRTRALRRRRTFLRTAGMSTAAAVLLAVGIGVAVQYFGREDGTQRVVRQAEQPQPADVVPGAAPVPVAEAKSLVRVKPADPSSAILVPIQTEAPNVTFVWIYNTVQPARAANGPQPD